MPLIVNLRQLEKKNIILRGEVGLSELDLEGVDECVRVALPITYDLEAQLVDDGVLVQGSLEVALECACVRCLKTFQRPLDFSAWICHLDREGEDAVKVVNDCVDLTPYLREDILLSFPQHPLCEPGCNGLPNSSTSSMHQTSGASQDEEVSSAWAELNKLKL